MPLPTMTPEQRKAALAKAAEARRARTQLLESLRSGKKKLSQVLKKAQDDPVVGKTKVSQLLRAIPGMGPAKVTALMDEIGIDDNRRAGGLGDRQRQELIQKVG
ncbi:MULTISPECIES: integration host factor, actinobacterial type [Streptomyces]|uniref:Integration host factor, actinobacterial type n=1 Tax=Streptomyces chengmaiensis TaxID=3040919 RepID=A0ABT6HVH3_9ACTN|nr:MULTISPECIES: integration host factor, actinobacterial type [Streptomyces]MDH2392711.1 integration host factor, actinobacterial type [Streptomyces chengmaiensis]WRQ83009.1 integration host factor, actinobacterial type [Streptomyces sp. MUM 178J]